MRSIYGHKNIKLLFEAKLKFKEKDNFLYELKSLITLGRSCSS